MIHFLHVLTRAWLGLHAPGGAAVAPAAGASVPAAATAQPTADVVLHRVQQFYRNIQFASAEFRQNVHNATFGTSKQSDGKVWLLKPGMMRWDYYEKRPNGSVVVRKSFISNGKTLYVVNHANRQVLQKNLQHSLLPVAVTFLYGKGNLKSSFVPHLDRGSSYGNPQDYVLRLTPKQPSVQYKALYLVVSRDDYHVRESITIDASNNTNHFTFYAPDFKTPVQKSWFQFNPASVPSYQVINANQPNQVAPAPSPPAAAPPSPAGTKP